MGLFAFYQCRATRRQYQKKDLELKQAITDIEQSKIALQALVEEQKQSQDLLEDRVQERTLELNITLQELESVNQELERKNVSDELTGLHNRRFYDQKIQAEYRRSRRNLTPLSLVIIDIDHFKSVNDTYGHLVGDQCLIWLSKHIQKSLKRSTDKAFRYGGEEFCLILPDTDLTGAIALAEKLRETIATEHFQFEQANFSVTISCGVSTYQQQNDVTPEQLFSVADKALYKAKHNGRNQTQYHQFT
ncbi:GGDEF domain-containing protein [Colwellia sp. D2M02]|uniref:GGDEF domain-containing protein n=1 Tax=Colwellia sp. D2M02 TaxID=2841562 RepID=UPI0020917930|nr:GGDEF domain-containing protein [Colwellia sp. D2M02]